MTTATRDATRVLAAMGTEVTMQVVDPAPGAAAALDRAVTVVQRVAAVCTRFDPASPLMRANAAPRRRHRTPPELYRALRAAATAYETTGGLFDPRVLATLEAWGYDRTLPFAESPQVGAGRRTPPAPGRRRWRPRFDDRATAVRLGPLPVDLGGIAKGLAVQWASAELTNVGRAHLVSAGGDLQAAGAGPEGTGWRVAVEDPRGGADPVAVLTLTDRACATSSVRLRRWVVGGRPVHHLVDPRTGRPADTGLLSVTVVASDPAVAETWSKALFLAGRSGLRAMAEHRGLAAVFVGTDGRLGVTRAARPYLTWQAPHDR